MRIQKETDPRTVEVTINGTLPILLHKPTLMDPLHATTKAYKAISQKRKKTDEDYLSLYRLEYQAACYWDEQFGVHIPTDNLLACMKDGGKRSRKGADVERCVFFTDRAWSLQYKGPRTVEELYEHDAFRLIKPVRNSGTGGGVMRCRPLFSEWSVSFSFVLDGSIIDFDTARQIWREAGRYHGLCDERPNFGRFSVSKFELGAPVHES